MLFYKARRFFFICRCENDNGCSFEYDSNNNHVFPTSCYWTHFLLPVAKQCSQHYETIQHFCVKRVTIYPYLEISNVKHQPLYRCLKTVVYYKHCTYLLWWIENSTELESDAIQTFSTSICKLPLQYHTINLIVRKSTLLLINYFFFIIIDILLPYCHNRVTTAYTENRSSGAQHQSNMAVDIIDKRDAQVTSASRRCGPIRNYTASQFQR